MRTEGLVMNPTTIGRAAVLVAGALLIVAYAGIGPAIAQTATNLKCNGCVNSKDLHTSAKPAGADFADGADVVTLDDATSVKIRSVKIKAPGPGIVIVNATGQFSGPDGATVGIECGITTGTAAEPGHKIFIANKPEAGKATSLPVALTRGYKVDAGKTAYKLYCLRVSGITMSIVNSSLTAFFVPNRY